MSRVRWMMLGVAAIVAMATIGSARAAVETAKVALPEAVEKAFRAEFPKAEIVKLDKEVENGVTVYDIEFKDGDVARETDIAADGTILEASITIDLKAVPKAVMKGIEKAAEGATVKRVEKIEIRCEAEDGKITKLDKPKINYEAELTKGDKTGEVTVDDKGNVVEAAKYGEEKKDEGADRRAQGPLGL